MNIQIMKDYDKMKRKITIVLAILFFICFWTTLFAGEKSLEGNWIGKFKTKTIRLYFNSDSRNRYNDFGISINILLEDLQGLDLSQIDSPSSNIHFSLRRGAGTIDFDGILKNRRAAGIFEFEVNPDFIKDMEALGYTRFHIEDFFIMAIHDLDQDFIKEIEKMGYRTIVIFRFILS